MAITKINHIGTEKATGNASLYRSIRYIMNPEKTRAGLLVGSNVGIMVDEIYDAMVQTKKDWGKEGKRLGYHFVISFAPGEATEEQTYQVLQEFAEEYLGDDYDYVFAVHNDQKHMHGHLIFNSVNRMNGYKYRYEKGDWEKYIQPITDRICERLGLPKLEFDEEKKKGKTYAEHNAEKEGRPTWTKIIRADIDYVITKSDSFEDFIHKMEELGYTIKQKKHLAFIPPGSIKGRRDTTLGKGYSAEEIRERIAFYKKYHKDKQEQTVIIDDRLLRAYDKGVKTYLLHHVSYYQFRHVQLYFNVRDYLQTQNPYVVEYWRTRKSAVQIERLYDECVFLLKNGLDSKEDLERQLQELEKETSVIRGEIRRLKNAEERDTKDTEENWKEKLKEKNSEKRMVKKILVEMEEGYEKFAGGRQKTVVPERSEKEFGSKK